MDLWKLKRREAKRVREVRRKEQGVRQMEKAPPFGVFAILDQQHLGYINVTPRI